MASWMPPACPASFSSAFAFSMSGFIAGSLKYSGWMGATWWSSPATPLPRYASCSTWSALMQAWSAWRSFLLSKGFCVTCIRAQPVCAVTTSSSCTFGRDFTTSSWAMPNSTV